MACSSVTGKGLGSADTRVKGSEHLSVGAEKLIGPRVVAAGEVTLSGGAATLVLPVLPGVTADYIVTVQDKTGANAASAALTLSATGTSIVFAGNGTDVLQYAVIKVGLAV